MFSMISICVVKSYSKSVCLIFIDVVVVVVVVCCWRISALRSTFGSLVHSHDLDRKLLALFV